MSTSLEGKSVLQLTDQREEGDRMIPNVGDHVTKNSVTSQKTQIQTRDFACF